MRRQAIGLAVLTAALVTPAWGDDKGAAEDEKLYGTWVVTKTEFLDKSVEIPEGQQGAQSIAFAKGGKASLKKTGKEAEEGTYKLGAAKTPREIDITSPSTDGKKTTLKAIYQFDGDSLKIAFPLKEPDGERPTTFDPKTAGIITFKRQKP